MTFEDFLQVVGFVVLLVTVPVLFALLAFLAMEELRQRGGHEGPRLVKDPTPEQLPGRPRLTFTERARRHGKGAALRALEGRRDRW